MLFDVTIFVRQKELQSAKLLDPPPPFSKSVENCCLKKQQKKKKGKKRIYVANPLVNSQNSSLPSHVPKSLGVNINPLCPRPLMHASLHTHIRRGIPRTLHQTGWTTHHDCHLAPCRLGRLVDEIPDVWMVGEELDSGVCAI